VGVGVGGRGTETKGYITDHLKSYFHFIYMLTAGIKSSQLVEVRRVKFNDMVDQLLTIVTEELLQTILVLQW